MKSFVLFILPLKNRANKIGQTAEVRSKHGLILDCALKTDDAWAKDELETFGTSLAGKRYGFIENEVRRVDGPAAEVSAWLAEEMSK